MAVTNDRIREILGSAEQSGARLVIHERLDRGEYVAVNKVLENLGGTWSRRDKAHLFDDNPAERLRAVVEDGWMPQPARKAEGFVRTPKAVADALVRDYLGDLAEWDEFGEPMVVEPSAGDGVLVQAIVNAFPAAQVLAVEPNRERAQDLDKLQCTVVTREMERIVDDQAGLYHAVVMNPPFATPANATLWIDHVFAAWRLLRPGGRLVALVPAGYAFRDDRRHRAVRQLVEDNGGGTSLPDDAFSESGSAVRTMVIWADKPHEAQPARSKRGKPTDEQKQQRREDTRELVEEANTRLEDDEYVERLERAMEALPQECRLVTYSQRNQALVMIQALEKDITVTGHLNTFKGWQEQGRSVRKGQSALRIVAAMGHESETHQQRDREDEQSEPRKRFRMTTRFDYSQTGGVEDE